MVLDFLLIAIPVCIVCARLYYVAFTWNEYSGNILKIFEVWEGGLAIYGALIGGVISAIIFYKWRKVPIGDMLDIGSPSIIIGQAIGRWGNFVNQEAFGNPITDPNWQWFPSGVYIDHPVINGIVKQPGWYQATFFYESMWNLITFAILMIFRKKIKIRGGVFALYIIFYGFGRFWIESQRTDSLMWGSIRVSSCLALYSLHPVSYILC
jgi:phosphatidylglycerol:prolipoprotein diacylglycerol transferase